MDMAATRSLAPATKPTSNPSLFHDGDKTNGWRWATADPVLYTWFARLFEDPEFLQNISTAGPVLRTNNFATSNILARIDGWAGLSQTEIRADR